MSELVVGSYRASRRLGQGGMGVVYLAEHALLGSPAVVKMLLPEFSEQKEVVERFFNEAKAATRIKHPGIVQIFDFGYHTDTKSAYIVMELLEGESLSARLQRGRMPDATAATIARQVASALHAAHKTSIVHRDLKPDNIFLVPDPELPEGERAKILDFGIAKLADGASRQTRTGEVFGTPIYMSPEQCQNAASVDARTDIYALGCILYEMLVGRPPFVGGGITQLITAHMFQAPRPPREFVPTISPALEAIVLRALAKAPADRQTSMGEIVSELDQLLGRRAATPVQEPALGTAETMSPSQPPIPPRPSQEAVAVVATTLGGAVAGLDAELERPRRRTGLFLGGAAVLAVGAVIALVLTRGSQEPTPVTPGAAPLRPLDAAVQETAPADAVPAARDDKEPELEARMRGVLLAFLRWSAAHPRSACPELATLGAAGEQRDAWGHPFRLTCTDQPADQIVGVVSAGPDGTFDTDDDTKSWSLGKELTDLVRGPRWAAADLASGSKPAMPRHVVTGSHPATAGGSAAPAPPPPPPPGDGSGSAVKPKRPVILDENGMPIHR